MTVIKVTPETIGTLKSAIERHTFADLVIGREDEFPTLSRASRMTIPAKSVYVEWLVQGAFGFVGVWENWQQISRYPYAQPIKQGSSGTGGHKTLEEAHSEGLTKFLAGLERTLEFGTPGYERTGSHPISFCGGYRHYLERDLNAGDRLILRPLQEPVLMEFHEGNVGGVWQPLDTPTYEWLCETSLAVIPGSEF